MKKIILFTLLIQIFTTSCSANSNLYGDQIGEVLQDPKSRKFKSGDSDFDNLSGCPALIKMSSWHTRKLGTEKSNNVEYVHIRDYAWRDKNIVSEPDIFLDLKDKLSNKILAKDVNYPVYIGPWQYSPTLKKTIRFFAYTGIGGGNIQYQYESQTEENKNIKEKPFSLTANASVAPDRFGLCVVKWTAKFGYNAIAEVKSKNPFSSNYLVPTGRIINIKESEE